MAGSLIFLVCTATDWTYPTQNVIFFLSRVPLAKTAHGTLLFLGSVEIPQLGLPVTMHGINERAWEDLMGCKIKKYHHDRIYKPMDNHVDADADADADGVVVVAVVVVVVVLYSVDEDEVEEM
ncbi:hypothetical protein TEQG_06890 [Trichophyton equinum CBS 127.97]|uniref:Uncharacterized protein n=1 Tax=Trichophyton equinum (strain ATCC MYA-4606 / CBS 127.97) TaxID=559882 RepID=F2Q1X1_TRIEC|nr:hypothetical protein TEQG_06890 [Trichophyton equinum CBS 127.97]